MLKLIIKRSLGVLICGLLAGAAVADSQQDVSFGVIDALYHEKSAFVVGDLYRKFDIDMEVFSVDGRKVNRYALIKGQKIVYELNENDTNSVSSVWIKPVTFSGVGEGE